MRIQTILNRVEKFKSFSYGHASLVERDDGPALVVMAAQTSRIMASCICGGTTPVMICESKRAIDGMKHSRQA